MFSTDDTIVAIATPPGRGGIGVVRLSGPEARRVAAEVSDAPDLKPRHATLARARHGSVQDQVIVTSFPAPASYTGEDVVEISAHGSPVVLQAILESAMANGARLAAPGEFTFRAYLHGRMDLVQAEAVRDLVDAVTPLQVRAAFDQLDGTLTGRISTIDTALFNVSARIEASLDFPEEGYHFVQPGELARELGEIGDQIARLLTDARRGRLVREGARVVILGRPNAGKSTLFNALAGAHRAIVTDIPGTTRDLVTEVVDVNGIPITLVDTAGLRPHAADAVESEGIARARSAAAAADLLLIVLDRSRALGDEDQAILQDTAARPRIVVTSKCDLPSAWVQQDGEPGVAVSPLTGHGLDDLRSTIVDAMTAAGPADDPPAVTNVRHVALLERALTTLARARGAAADAVPEEFVAADVREAREALEEITGARTADDTLHAIFDTFCIGK
jgi:tRNA modification GTPase